MTIIITNIRTNEQRVFAFQNQNTIEEAIDYLVNRVNATYPKVYKLVADPQNHIRIKIVDGDGNVTKAIFDINVLEDLRDNDDKFFC